MLKLELPLPELYLKRATAAVNREIRSLKKETREVARVDELQLQLEEEAAGNVLGFFLVALSSLLGQKHNLERAAAHAEAKAKKAARVYNDAGVG